MGLLGKVFGKKEEPIKTYNDFWNWFLENEKSFYEVVKNSKNIEKDFFNKLSPKLDELKEGFLFLTGMCDDTTAELVLTPDGIVKNIVFVEELVNAAPKLPNWKFTALKPALDIERVGIRMGNYEFGNENLFFYPNDHENYPDEVDIVIAHKDYKESDKSLITNGVYILLDNYLGELNSVTTLDNVTVIAKEQAEKELIPISKLKDFLIWREKEFVEKYSGKRHNTENDNYSSLQAEMENGLPLIAIINSTLLNWDSKASHPWMLTIELKYNGSDNNGLPDEETYALLTQFEDEVMLELKDQDGYLNLGRQTADSERLIYFACKDFRKPSKVIYEFTKKYAGKLDLNYEIFKDKYWQSMERFRAD